jgi:arabinan endo-1,5-alpha-L-arabinosidase
VVAGKIGNAYSFDGTTRLQISGSPALEMPNAFTVAVWFRVAAVPTSLFVAMSQEVASSHPSWQLVLDQTPQVQYITYDGSSEDDYGSSVFALGAWHHVALRWDGATKTIVFDGVLAIGPMTAQRIAFDGSPAFIGADSAAPQFPLVGLVDDMRIYNAALSDAEIAQLAAQ